ncbi:MAG TPA: HRDC domain-containing protein [Planctomycetota bacterium]|nr:HRDC domain-containing protein [Planctomycetota bacterium]
MTTFPTLITAQSELDALVDHLSGRPELALDCEMDSMYAYRTSLCLVQIGWEGGEALIDALRDLDRSGLAALCDDPGVVKVFHGGENDIGLLSARWGFSFRNIFDTMAASQVLGHDGFGLAALLDRNFGVHVSKKFQKADWRVRPLPDAQAEYARIDVRYLVPLRRTLLGELEARHRVEEVQSEFRRISKVRSEEKPFDPENWVRIKGAREAAPADRATLRELYVARDAIARELDRAPYRVLHESALLDLARLKPAGAGAVRRVHGINRGLYGAHIDLLAEAIERGRAVTDFPFPKKPRPGPGDRFGAGPLTPEQLQLFDALRAWRSLAAHERGVEVARIATNALLTAIVRRHPQTREELAQVDGMEEWRMREYGEPLLAVLLQGAGA